MWSDTLNTRGTKERRSAYLSGKLEQEDGYRLQILSLESLLHMALNKHARTSQVVENLKTAIQNRHAKRTRAGREIERTRANLAGREDVRTGT